MTFTGFIVLCLSVLTIIIYNSAETRHTEWRTTLINSGVNNLIVGTVTPSISVLRCAFECSKSSQYKSFYYSTSLQGYYCNMQIDGTADTTTVDTGLIYGISKTNNQQKDCLGLYQRGISTDGVYVIHPLSGVPVNAWCDMTGGGWTVIQRRQDGSESFNRLWNDYVKGFGSVTGEYWLGLENMHILTIDNSTLRIELESTNITGFAEYSHFVVGASVTKYTLSVSGFTGDFGDSLSSYHNEMMFSTMDSDNDNATWSCASTHSGAGSWYRSCFQSNLNFPYASGIRWHDGTCMSTASKSVMKIKRNI